MTDLQHDTVSAAVDALLAPRTVAIIGASDSSGFSRRLVNNLERHQYTGEVFLVNPRRPTVAGKRCYPTVAAVPGSVDLAIVMVASEHVVTALRECAAAGVTVASVAASGFAEAGKQGRIRQDEIAAIADETGMRIVGPNCMGVVVQRIGLVATFSQAVDIDLLAGSGVAYVGQSGAIGGAVLGLCRERGIGLSAWCTAGNEVDLTSVDIACGMVQRTDIETVALYLESVPDGSRWVELVESANMLDKRVVLLRSGRSRAGQRAAASHTGAMVRGDVAFDLINRELGVITVDDVTALIDVLEALEFRRARPGTRVGVVTSSGGLGTMMADALEHVGLPLAELSEATRADISALIPDYGSTQNPVDVTAQLFNGDGTGFEHVCASIMSDPNVDSLAILLTTIVGDAATRLASSIARVVGAQTKHAFVVWVAPQDQTQHARKVLHGAGIPTGSAIRPQLELLKNLDAGFHRLRRPQPSTRSAAVTHALTVVAGRTGTMTEVEGGALLDALTIGRPRGALVSSPDEAAAVAAQLGDQVVMKIQSPQILHKSDVGGVAVGVPLDQVKDTYAAILRSGKAADVIHGILVQEMAAPGLELILSVTGGRDGYPPIVTVGFGGVTAELTRDFVSDLAPLHRDAALDLLKRLRGWPLLNGFRGRPAVDVAGLIDAMCTLSEFAADAADGLIEVEINPLRVSPAGVIALDLLIELNGRDNASIANGDSQGSTAPKQGG
jgi:acetate---CoA ligase (ADP-forming)